MIVIASALPPELTFCTPPLATVMSDTYAPMMFCVPLSWTLETVAPE